MRTVTSMPQQITVDEQVWIPMPDGVRPAAKVWRPVASDDAPVPGILEYIPYRKRDLSAVRDSIHHPYLAGHGYGCVRVDLRGTGESEGVLADEYLEREHLDAEAVLAWMAARPWCNGRLGMMGISSGGRILFRHSGNVVVDVFRPRRLAGPHRDPDPRHLHLDRIPRPRRTRRIRG